VISSRPARMGSSGIFTTHDNSVIRDWGLFRKGEDRAADLNGLEERSLVCHCDVAVVVAERGCLFVIEVKAGR
jgi:hypothetical protein